MNNCSNCFNGCTDIVSDQCVKYTGVDIPVLGIQNGDSLSFVEQALIEFLTSTLDGTGIKIDIPEGIICELVETYLPTCADLTAVDLFKTLIQVVCDLQTQIDTINATLTTLNADYTVGCLTGVVPSSDTHLIVQAIITKLCAIDVTLTALALNLTTNYVLIADLNALIQAYLDSIAPNAQQYNKMVPYTALEYYGSLANFDGAGIGIAILGWEDIYICNGANGTPDKRGRLPVGAIQAVPGGGPLNSVVDPSISGNPNYSLSSTAGTNVITLTSTEIPAHTHVTTSTVTDAGHTHFNVPSGTSGSAALTNINSIIENYPAGTTNAYILKGSASTPDVGLTSESVTGISVAVANASTGGGSSHNNIPPVLACYYIMYIP